MNQIVAETKAEPQYEIPFADRLAILRNVAELLRTRRDEVLQILFESCNYRTAVGEIEVSIATLEGAEQEMARFRPPRLEQLAVLMPSNIPLYSYILYLLIPSLYSDRLVFRPSGRISSQTERLHKLLGEAHGLPIVLRQSGQRDFLRNDVTGSQVLVFTGAFENAEKIRGQLRKDQLFLYFGQGINPFVVGPDADVGKAVDGALRARMLNSGQDCFGPDVYFVHTSVSSQFFNLLSRRVRSLKHGRHEDPTADYGSMYYLDAFEGALAHLVDDRVYILVGGRADLTEGHLTPTVLVRPVESVAEAVLETYLRTTRALLFHAQFLAQHAHTVAVTPC
ncbi:aldehyde dehydrogenase family protein [Streptomyces griseoviridis]|uniref:aldehyde dehydrogenase family protein n=1 Tax=Streptomyces griseoviridis TaxID=45398 RepID=UPI0013E2FACB|nr:aldehyde dehydrogenase family protein [Streptomyces griseoviridis]